MSVFVPEDSRATTTRALCPDPLCRRLREEHQVASGASLFNSRTYHRHCRSRAVSKPTSTSKYVNVDYGMSFETRIPAQSYARIKSGNSVLETVQPVEKLAGCFVGDYSRPLSASVQTEILLTPRHYDRRFSPVVFRSAFFNRLSRFCDTWRQDFRRGDHGVWMHRLRCTHRVAMCLMASKHALSLW